MVATGCMVAKGVRPLTLFARKLARLSLLRGAAEVASAAERGTATAASRRVVDGARKRTARNPAVFGHAPIPPACVSSTLVPRAKKLDVGVHGARGERGAGACGGRDVSTGWPLGNARSWHATRTVAPAK